MPWDRWPTSPIIVARRPAPRSWRTIDEELLALTHDSLELADAAVRGALDVRTLGFETDGLSLEVEVDGDRVFGQVLDAEVDEIVVESVEDGSQAIPVDSSGIFSVVVLAGWCGSASGSRACCDVRRGSCWCPVLRAERAPSLDRYRYEQPVRHDRCSPGGHCRPVPPDVEDGVPGSAGTALLPRLHLLLSHLGGDQPRDQGR